MKFASRGTCMSVAKRLKVSPTVRNFHFSASNEAVHLRARGLDGLLEAANQTLEEMLREEVRLRAARELMEDAQAEEEVAAKSWHLSTTK